jgi:hypothetical protein
MPATTHHTFPDLLTSGDRLAATDWGSHPAGCASLSDAVAATLSLAPDAIILRAVRGSEAVRGLAPGGLAA